MSRSKKVFIVAIFVIVLFAIAGYCVYIAPKPEDDAWKRTLEPTQLPERETPELPYIDIDPKLHIERNTTLDPNIITIDNTLKNVTLCEGTYKTKQIFIDGVDVVQRLADILSEKDSFSDKFCTALQDVSKKLGGGMDEKDEIHISIASIPNGFSLSMSLAYETYDISSTRPSGVSFIVIPKNVDKDIHGGLGFSDFETIDGMHFYDLHK